jgi:hypothetical protein
MLPYSFIGAGTYTNAATALPTRVPLSDVPDWFFLRDITIGSTTAGWGGGTGNPGPVTTYAALAQVSSEWFSSMAPGSFLQTGQAASAAGAAALYPTQGSTGGFTFVDLSHPPTFAALPITSTINHTTWVIGMTNTGTIQVGDIVRLINPTGMRQAASIVAQVTAVTANTSITLGYIATAVSNGANFTADATGGSILKLIPQMFYPKKLQVMEITQATEAKVYFAQPNDFTPGEIVDFNIPVLYGMTQLSFLTSQPGGAPRVLSVTNTATESSITLDINTTGFTPFAYPTSAGSVGKESPPFCFPAGSGVVPLNGNPNVPVSPPGTNLQDAFDNRNQFYMYIGSNVVGANSATMQWMAFKADYGNLSNA